MYGMIDIMDVVFSGALAVNAVDEVTVWLKAETLTRPIVSASASQCSVDLGRHSFLYWSFFDG